MDRARWTGAEDGILLDLWRKGHSGSQISGELKRLRNFTVSRSAVIARAHRRGWADERPVSAKNKASPAKPKAGGKAATPPRAVPRIASLAVVAPKPAPEPVPFLPSSATGVKADSFAPLDGIEPVKLLDLKLSSCRWPVAVEGCSGHFYCGDARVSPSSYCPTHRAMSLGRGTESERRAHSVVLA